MRASITAKIMITAAAAVFALSLTAYAGQWKNDSRGWWYQNDDGSYPAATWQWIDSNGDGVAECQTAAVRSTTTKHPFLPA